MVFAVGNNEGSKRKYGLQEQGGEKRNSLDSTPWTSAQLAVKDRVLGLEEFDGWIALTTNESWIAAHINAPTLPKLIDARPSRFENIVKQRLGQLWGGTCYSWKSVMQTYGFSWASSPDWASHFVIQGSDTDGNRIYWVNLHPNPTGCPPGRAVFAAATR
jgi:hypothetical protein